MYIPKEGLSERRKRIMGIVWILGIAIPFFLSYLTDRPSTGIFLMGIVFGLMFIGILLLAIAGVLDIEEE